MWESLLYRLCSESCYFGFIFDCMNVWCGTTIVLVSINCLLNKAAMEELLVSDHLVGLSVEMHLYSVQKDYSITSHHLTMIPIL